ncbi:MAG: Unknown protein [uncultured Sulfurovum sp.]|uniref:DUF6868 domain-containing protein n=1 Tax=uncultured Sulfurovum sp. TaxID=269237 RepID=A0A6S6UEZ1_9BACT|nr:MAG: Unknown protein [uncultured Sulfurovum sp.]
MESLLVLESFFGWCAVINVGLLLLTLFIIVVFRDAISHLHAQIFKIPKEEVVRAYYHYIALYKIIVIVFNVVPYFVLKYFI